MNGNINIFITKRESLRNQETGGLLRPHHDSPCQAREWIT
jgi:hypothetical protein